MALGQWHKLLPGFKPSLAPWQSIRPALTIEAIQRVRRGAEVRLPDWRSGGILPRVTRALHVDLMGSCAPSAQRVRRGGREISRSMSRATGRSSYHALEVDAQPDEVAPGVPLDTSLRSEMPRTPRDGLPKSLPRHPKMSLRRRFRASAGWGWMGTSGAGFRARKKGGRAPVDSGDWSAISRSTVVVSSSPPRGTGSGTAVRLILPGADLCSLDERSLLVTTEARGSASNVTLQRTCHLQGA